MVGGGLNQFRRSGRLGVTACDSESAKGAGARFFGGSVAHGFSGV